MDEHSAQAPKYKTKRKLPRKLSQSYLRNASLYYLQRYPCSAAHFVEVMSRKIARSAKAHGTPEDEVEVYIAYVRDELVDEFVRAGYLNDTLYAKALVDSLQRKGLPQKAITYRLAAKGVAPDAEQLAAQDDLEAAILFARRKRLGPYANKERELKKDLAALARAGFTYDVAMRVLSGEF